MKTLFTVAVMTLFLLAVGTAYADEMPVFGSSKDIGTELFIAAFASPDVALAEREAKGSAAGGVAKEDERTRIWDSLLAVPLSTE
ncbi:MAG: hypothetical protein AABZ15_12175 [Nitrospirota bacterium]